MTMGLSRARGGVLVVLAACGGQNAEWEWGDLQCEHDPHGWYDTPTLTLLRADGRGDFVFDPPGDPSIERSGSFDFETGRLTWDEGFAIGFPRVALHADGTGSIGDDGDLSLTYSVSALDVLDQVWASEVTVERTGCAEQWSVYESGPDGTAQSETSSTIVSDDEVTGRLVRSESDVDVVLDYTDARDLSRAYTMAYAVGDWSFSGEGTDLGDGTGVRDWTGWDPEYDYVGHFDFHFDGSLDHAYAVSEEGVPAAEIAYHEDYAGTGVGTWSYYDAKEETWLVCDYAFDDEDCTIVCPDLLDPIPCS
jgi:hypothetical protein